MNSSGESTHEEFMQLALVQARLACEMGEVPVGAVLVKDDEVVSTGFNASLTSKDATAHAEIVALRKASVALSNYRLPGTTLYVTVEPCLMCIGAMVHARIRHLVYGVAEPKTGAVESQLRGLELPYHNHRVTVTGGILAAECLELMQSFFIARR